MADAVSSFYGFAVSGLTLLRATPFYACGVSMAAPFLASLFQWLRRLKFDGFAVSRFAVSMADAVSRFAVSMASPFLAARFQWLTPFLVSRFCD